jgi:hypothetical protein
MGWLEGPFADVGGDAVGARAKRHVGVGGGDERLGRDDARLAVAGEGSVSWQIEVLATEEPSPVVGDDGWRRTVLLSVIEAPAPVVDDDDVLNSRSRGGRHAGGCVREVVDVEWGGWEVE